MIRAQKQVMVIVDDRTLLLLRSLMIHLTAPGRLPMEKGERPGLADDTCPIDETTILLGNGR